MPTKKAKIPETELLLLLPMNIQPLFNPPPLLRSEKSTIYVCLLIECIKTVKPEDYFEWVWVKDIAFLNWEIRRLYEFKFQCIEIGRAKIEMDEIAKVPQGSTYVANPSLNSDAVSAAILLLDQSYFDNYQALDRLIASAELRRDKIIRELECRREYMARRLQKASAEIIVGQLGDKKSAA